MLLTNILVILIAAAICGECTISPEVKTPLGIIEGTYERSIKGRTYSAFNGIPYAKPPVGDLRFKEPQEITKPWKGVITANFTSICIQLSHWPEPEGGFVDGQEDCLYVNVYVPHKNPTKASNLDVIVHIHGGGLNFGSSFCYSGEKLLMDRDVIFVTFNYRVGPFGFLSTEDDVVPGNNGMKDQSMALKWVKRNIQYFGGNPESITLTGLSAGGASVHFHYLSPLSKGLFNRGISVSGTALCPWPVQEAPLAKARILASKVGCRQLDTKEMIECLKERPAAYIAESSRIFKPWLYNPFSTFGVVVEKPRSGAFISKQPYEIISSGEVQDLPWINTVTSHEGLYPASDYVLKEHYLPELEKRWEELAPYVLDYDYTIPVDQKVKVAKMVKDYYLKGSPISRETFEELVQMMSDRLFVVPAITAAKLQSQVNESPVHFYYFSYNNPEVPIFAIYYSNSEENLGVGHGQDLIYVLSNPKNPAKTVTDKEGLEMLEIMLDFWTEFAKTGKANINGINWTQVSSDPNAPLDYLHIRSPKSIEMEQNDNLGHVEFWSSIPFQENENVLPKINREEL